MSRTLTVHASGAETSTVNSNTFELKGTEIGALFILDITAASGTPTLDLKIQFVDEVSGKFVDVPGAAFAQKTGTGTDSLIIYPGVTAAANRAVSYALGKTIRAVQTIGGGTPSLTYTLSMQTIGG